MQNIEINPNMLSDYFRIFMAVPKTQNLLLLATLGLSSSFLLYNGALFGIDIFQKPEKALITTVGTNKTHMAGNHVVSLTDYAPLQNSTWFGNSLLLDSQQLEVKDIAVETTLNFALKGTIMGNNPRAIITNNSNNSSLVLKEGEELMKNVTVSQIFRRRVMLNNKGNLESLSLPSADNVFDDYQEREVIKVVGDHSKKPAKKKKNDGYIPLAKRKIDIKQRIKLNKLEAVSAVANLGKLSKEARFMPYIKSNKLEAFRIGNLKHDSFLKKLSLQEGDILVKLDDVPVHNREKLFPMIMNMSTAKSAELVIQRRGKIIAIQVDIS